MERKNANASPPSPSPAPPSELCTAKGSSSSSSPTTHSHSSGIFNSVFPPPTQLDGRDSPRCDIFEPPRKLENANPSWNATHNTSEEGKYGYNTDKEHKGVGKDKISIYQSERTGPCSLSNSLYYGGQDICVQSPKTSYTNKTDDEDDPASSHFASRGNWWQGSLYY